MSKSRCAVLAVILTAATIGFVCASVPRAAAAVLYSEDFNSPNFNSGVPDELNSFSDKYFHTDYYLINNFDG